MPETPAVPHFRRAPGRSVRAVCAPALHGVDKIGAVIALIVSVPVFAGMALVSLLQARGSMLQCEARIGVNGRIFRMFGFRAAAARHPVLNAFPQLLNVLRGEMSLIGPRPPLPEELARQLRVRPGILRLR